jgi:UDP-2-acetamido-2,6-beta-L-arabino-hexul-4-ose reductase
MIKLNTKKLKILEDDRGWLAEILKSSDVGKVFGQVILTTAYPGKTKGNHYHLHKREWYCVIKGKGLLTVRDINNNEEIRMELDDKNMLLVEIPRGYVHAITNIGKEMMYLLAYTDKPFDKNDPDTYYVDKRK